VTPAPDRPAPDAPDPLAPTPPGAPPSVRAVLAEARRVLDEDVTPGEWIDDGLCDIWSSAPGHLCDGDLVAGRPEFGRSPLGARRWPANARVLAAARRLLEHVIEAVEMCDGCLGVDDPAERCSICSPLLADIKAATGQEEGEK
jgi:hypothetical protein